MTTTAPPPLSPPVTVQQATQAMAAARHASQQYGTRRARALVAGNNMHWTNFRGKHVVAYMNGNKIDAVFSVNGDGVTPDPRSSAQIEIPPMLLTRKSSTCLEGNAFKKGGQGENKYTVQRPSAKYSINARVGCISTEFAEQWHDAFRTKLADVQTAVCGEIAIAGRTLVRGTWLLDDSAFKPYKDVAIQHARDMVAKEPQYATMNLGQFISECSKDEALRARVNAVALEYYVRKAKIMCEPRYDKETGEELPLVVLVNSKVFKIRDFSNGAYNKEATGPTEKELPSTLENMPAVIKRMAMLGGGLDARDYRMLKFVDGSKPPGDKDYNIARPTTVVNGETIPDYGWDPLHVNADGEVVSSMVVYRATFMLTASPTGGYGATLALSGRRVIQIVAQKVVESLPTMDYGALMATGVAKGRASIAADAAATAGSKRAHSESAALTEVANKVRAAAVTTDAGSPTRVPVVAEAAAAAPPPQADAVATPTLDAEPQHSNASDDLFDLFNPPAK